jgi:hypothetical protein
MDKHVEFTEKRIYEIPAEMNMLKETMQNSINKVDELKSKLLGMSTVSESTGKKNELKVETKIIEVPVII